jgi:hypothetical protein
MNDELNYVLKFSKVQECKWYNNKIIDNSLHLWYPNNIKFTKNNKYSNKNYKIENCINTNQIYDQNKCNVFSASNFFINQILKDIEEQKSYKLMNKKIKNRELTLKIN